MAARPPTAKPALLWYRRDLRVADNPALDAAVRSGRPVVPVYILDDTEGAAGRWWLHHSLAALSGDLRRLGAPLVLRRGGAQKELLRLITETGAEAVYWNREYTPAAITRDTTLKEALKQRGITAESFNAALLHEPWTVKTGGGTPFKVFTPFWNAIRARGEPTPTLPAPKSIPGHDIAGDTLDDWNLLPSKPDWAAGFRENWRPGETSALARLDDFLSHELLGYAAKRDIPALPATSRLSPYLHYGEIGPRQVWRAATLRAATHPELASDAGKFLSELAWREFSWHLLFSEPELPANNLRPNFDAFPWAQDAKALKAWQLGRTGYPIVDAGMRELWHTGWVHNRVRMIVASFLVKHLLIHWREGAAWFMDTLVDADLANNSASWQWVAGCGADAAPYFRIFNPVLQGQKFDAQGTYVRRWIPELTAVPDKWVHQPWAAPQPPGGYPAPIVDHRFARDRALTAFASIGRAAA